MSKNQSKSPTKIKLFLVATCFVAVTLSLTQLVLANSLSTKGDQIRELEQKKQIKVYANLELKNKIARETSFSYIEEQAGKRLGMVKAAGSDRIEFIKIRDEVLALKK